MCVKKLNILWKTIDKKKNEQKDKVVYEGNVLEPLNSNTVDLYEVAKPNFNLDAANLVENSDVVQEMNLRLWIHISFDF